MKSLRLLTGTVVLLIAGTGSARADLLLTPFAGLKFAGSTNITDPVDLDRGASNTKLTLAGIVTVIGDGPFGVEGEVGYTPRFFERSSGTLIVRSHVLTIMGNVIVTTPRQLTGYSLRPFVSGGAGLMYAAIEDVLEVFEPRRNLFAFNVGGGAVGGLTADTSLRFEVRYFKSVTSAESESARFGTRLSFWRAGVGLAIRY